MSGGGSFTSDQSVAHATSTAQMVSLNKRARLTSIQAKGNSASGSIIFKSGGASGTTIATFLFGEEGLDMFIPGSGILNIFRGFFATLSINESVLSLLFLKKSKSSEKKTSKLVAPGVDSTNGSILNSSFIVLLSEQITSTYSINSLIIVVWSLFDLMGGIRFELVSKSSIIVSLSNKLLIETS